MPVIRDEQGQMTAIICSRPKLCAYCGENSVKLCDAPLIEENKTCDTPMCAKHSWRPPNKPEHDYCRAHRRQIEGPEREALRKAELATKKRSTLIFFARSKYAGYCREKDCGAKWEQGEQCYWDSKTREVFCTECGELMQEV